MTQKSDGVLGRFFCVEVSRGWAPCVDPVVEEGTELLQGLRAGDPQAFDALYEACSARVFSFLLRLTQNRPLAEDLLQETWLRAAKNAHRLAPDSRPGAWVFRIAHNVFVSHRRWAMLDLERLGQLRASARPTVPITPFDARVATELQQRLEVAMAQLPLRHREVLSLVAVGGLEPSGVAEVLGLSAVTARQRLKRARDALAEALGEDTREALGRTS